MVAPKTASGAERRAGFDFEKVHVPAGTMRVASLQVARLPTETWAMMPVAVVHGTAPGPTIWLSGAIHGDELNGIEIVRRSLLAIDPERLAGTVIAVPIVNVFGVNMASRYLPDRRDLNRSFPGSPRGSLAARQAHLFFDRVVRRCELGLDFHTGSGGRSNLPQVRCDLDDPRTRLCGEAFAPRTLLHSTLRDGSLRAAARREGIRVLMYEGGEASRFDADVIRRGIDGTLRVLRHLRMTRSAPGKPRRPTLVSRRSKWMRAGRSGFCRLRVDLGDRVAAGHPVATVSGSLGKEEVNVKSRVGGVVIGLSRAALVHRGDALVHVAEVEA